MGPFQPMGEFEALIFLVLIVGAIACWFFQKGSKAAADRRVAKETAADLAALLVGGGPKPPKLVCAKCGTEARETFSGEGGPSLCAGCFAAAYPAAWRLLHPDTPSRDTTSPTKPSATG